MHWKINAAAAVFLVSSLGAAPCAAQTDTRPPPVLISPAPRVNTGLPTSVTWAHIPRPAFPQEARGAGRTYGEVTLRCTSTAEGLLAGCSVVREAPRDLGFARSALESAREARVIPQTMNGGAMNTIIQFQITLREVDAASGQPAYGEIAELSRSPVLPPPEGGHPVYITNPTWARRPMPRYPELAEANNVLYGRVVVRCGVQPTGALTACEVLEENPYGQGFGAAALEAANAASLTPSTIDGAAPGGRVQFPITFRLGQEAMPQPRPSR